MSLDRRLGERSMGSNFPRGRNQRRGSGRNSRRNCSPDTPDSEDEPGAVHDSLFFRGPSPRNARPARTSGRARAAGKSVLVVDAPERRFTHPLRPSCSTSSLPSGSGPNPARRNRSASALERYSISTNFRLVISGFDPNSTDRNQLIAFLRKQSEKPVFFLKHHFDGARLLIEFATENDLQSVLDINGAFYGTSKLFIRPFPEPFLCSLPSSPEAKSERIELLLNLIKERYNPSSLVLDLSYFATDARLIDNKLFFKSTKVREVITQLMKVENIVVEHLSLAGNEIADLNSFAKFFENFPSLKSLSLADNCIEDFNALRLMKPDVFPKLIGLDLRSNPIANGVNDRYRRLLSERLPNLSSINGSELAVAQFAIGGSSISLPEMEVLPDLYDSAETRDLVNSFLSVFFSAAEKNPEHLAALYHPEAVFSLNLPTSTIKSFSKYVSANRNIKFIRKREDRFKRLYFGITPILYAIQNFPQCEYKKSSMIVDAWTSSNLAANRIPTTYIHVHGDMVTKTSPSSDYVHSFDRTFVLIASSLGTMASGAPPSYLVIHDMFCIRPRVPGISPWKKAVVESQSPPSNALLPAPQPAMLLPATQLPPQVTAGLVPAAGISVLSVLPPRPQEMTEDAYLLVLRAMYSCGLTWEGAILCLNETSGNLDQVLAAKTENKIPLSLLRT